ncbi:hypothetical protein ANCCAN_01584 [Ancylostoma caninum]|uniref:Uncharacterized protein n=1 Tax=Ancylostoma caninum TaxID=29170 RepID=A0A368H6F8_ANCCA|nr:hypothetical protein ANCCAN_01584 [Ancylostoma caninum]
MSQTNSRQFKSFDTSYTLTHAMWESPLACAFGFDFRPQFVWYAAQLFSSPWLWSEQ